MSAFKLYRNGIAAMADLDQNRAMKVYNVIYWISTIIMVLIFGFSATMYFVRYEDVSGFYQHLGFPIWMIYPLAILKLLAILAILTKKSNLLKEWAYAGLFFDASAAIFAHGFAGDGWFGLSGIAFIMVIISRTIEDKIASSPSPLPQI